MNTGIAPPPPPRTARLLGPPGEADRHHELTMERHQPFVLAVASRYARITGVDLDDLMQEGQLGLGVALESFSYAFGTKASGFVLTAIKHAIFRATQEQAGVIRLPKWASEAMARFRREAARMEAEGVPNPTFEAVADRLGVAERNRPPLRAAWSVRHGIGRTEVDDPDFARPIERFAGRDEAPDLDPGSAPVASMLRGLPPVEREVLERRYGLNGREPQVLRAIGKSFGRTGEWARLAEARALETLRKRYGDHAAPA